MQQPPPAPADIAWSAAESLALHPRLLAAGLRIAVAESLTVGRVQTELGRHSGASAYLVGGVTCYELTSKIRLLGVDSSHATEVNAVSARVAEEMARGAARIFQADLALATTGYAEPDPSHHVTAPFAWIAVAHGENVRSLRVDGAGLDRTAMQARSAAAALRLLAAHMAGVG